MRRSRHGFVAGFALASVVWVGGLLAWHGLAPDGAAEPSGAALDGASAGGPADLGLTRDAHFGLVAEARAQGQLDRAGFDAAVALVLAARPRSTHALVFAEALAIAAMTGDPHGSYLSADARARIGNARVRGVGTGAVLHLERAPKSDDPRRTRVGKIVVADVLPDSPAAAAGVRVGQVVVMVDGIPAAAFRSQGDLEGALVGAAGEPLTLEFKPPTPRSRALLGGDPPRQVTLLRALLASVPELEAQRIDVDGMPVVILRLRRFSAGTGQRVRDAILRQRRLGAPAAMVLDLRGNPGGPLDEAVILADTFVDRGELLHIEGLDGTLQRTDTATRAGTDRSTPLVVLVDRHSASASEALAAMLHDHGRARVVGERTYGKGSVQTVTGLPDGSVLTLTTARFTGPTRALIDGVGVGVDVELAPVAEGPLEPSQVGEPATSAASPASSRRVDPWLTDAAAIAIGKDPRPRPPLGFAGRGAPGR